MIDINVLIAIFGGPPAIEQEPFALGGELHAHQADDDDDDDLP